METQPSTKPRSPAYMILGVVLVVIIATAAVIGGLLFLTPGQILYTSRDSTNPGGSHGSGSGSGTGTGSGGTNPSAKNPIYYKLWIDPREGAFSLLVPTGWTATQGSGTSRPYFGADFDFNATDSSGTIHVFFAKNGYPNFVTPYPSNSLDCQLLPSLGVPYVDPLCTPGSWWMPIQGFPSFSAYVWPYLSAQDFSKSLFLRLVQNAHPDATLISSANRPDLASSYADLVLSQTASGADALYSYTVNGVSYKMGVVITTTELTTNTYSGTPFTMWQYAYTGVSSPASDFTTGKNATTFYSHMIPTVRISKTWLQQEIKNQAQNSQLIAQTFSNIQQMDYRTFTDVSNSNYAVGEAWGDALGGVSDYVDSSGVVHTVDTPPLGYDYVWGDTLGDVTYTSMDQSPGQGYTLWQGCTTSSCPA